MEGEQKLGEGFSLGAVGELGHLSYELRHQPALLWRVLVVQFYGLGGAEDGRLDHAVIVAGESLSGEDGAVIYAIDEPAFVRNPVAAPEVLQDRGDRRKHISLASPIANTR